MWVDRKGLIDSERVCLELQRGQVSLRNNKKKNWGSKKTSIYGINKT